MEKKYFVHDKAIVETDDIGEGSRVWAFAHILPGAKIGKNANICDQCFVEGGVVIGDDVTVKCGVYLWNGVTIEDKVQVGPAAVFTNDLFPRAKNVDFKLEKTLLRQGCSIGANATILAGRVVGQYSLVGAAAVVTKDVPDFAIVVGNPARVMGYICACTKKIDFHGDEFTCECGRQYKKINEVVSLVSK